MEKSKIRKLAVSTGVGAVVGFIGAVSLLKLADTGILGALDASREIAALVGMLYVISGLFVAVGLASPNVGAKLLNVEDVDELREQAKMLRYSSTGMVLLGVALMLLAFAAPVGPVPQVAVLSAVIVMIAISWATSKKQMEEADELLQSISRETAATSFYLLFAVGGGWAILAHLGYVTGPAMLDWITMFAGLMLAAAFWVCGRRGMLTPR